MRAFLSTLREKNIHLKLEENELSIRFPKGKIDKDLLEEIKAKKTHIISYLSMLNEYRFSDIRVMEEQPDYMLSSSQRRLWILSQFEEANIAYNMPHVYVFEGNLDFTALEYAFAALIARHENLRTVFKEDENGEVKQFITVGEASRSRIVYRDVRQEKEKDRIVKDLVEEAFLTPFDLATGPLLRTGLYQVEDHKWVFNYVMHHVISDGWSMGILIKELLQLYNAYVRGEENPLVPLRIQYKDYAAWLQQQLNGIAFQAHKAYWLNHFAGELPVLELPADKVRPAVKTYTGGVFYKRLDTRVSKGIIAYSQEQGCTLFMALLAAVNTLLYRYTGQEDLIIGTPVAGREHVDLEDQIGFYANTLALRTQFSGTDNFKALLLNTRDVTLGAHEHQLYPFDELVDNLQIKHDRSRNPLFDVQVVLGQEVINNARAAQNLDGLQVSAYEGKIPQMSRFDMVFSFVETGENIQAGIQYNSDIYAESTVARMADHLEQLLAAIIASPETAIKELNYLSAAEKQQLLTDFNNSTADYPKDQTILDLFKEQVSLNPDNMAVAFEQSNLTYKALDEKSNLLANYLITEHEVKANDLIGIMLDRSEKMIISILGILKAGAAYVPIDPEYPEARKSFIIQDSAARLLITQMDYIFNLTYYKGAIFAIDVQLDEITSGAGSPQVAIRPCDLAYVIYTSGSTGHPKGVLIEHGNLVHATVPRILTYGKVDAFLLLSSIAFDSSVAGIFGTLCSGGKLCITAKMGPEFVVACLVENRVSHLLTVPSYYRSLLPVLEHKENFLKEVIVAGETCSTQLVEQHYQTHTLKTCGFFNEYGPTEGTVWSSVYKYDRNRTIISSIGKPIQNVQIYILNGVSDVVPVGVTGEICISGTGLARAYLNQPELTAAKFVPHPFREGERMYRTGDLGRWLPDGNIEFTGRKDEQVKIRGYRIELGEIAHTIQTHPEIDEAAVVVRSNAGDEKELIAYIVSKVTLSTSDLRAYLSTTLPDYMVPGHFFQLPQLPLTPNGKLDRKKLQDPEALGLVTWKEYIAPRNETEAKLVLMWEEILGKESIGMKDDFFELGGHSLKATRLASQIHKTFDVKVELKDLFTYAILEEQARLIMKERKALFITIPPVALQTSYALSSSQRRLWILGQFEVGNIAYNMPGVYTFEGNLDRPALEQAFTALIARHEILRTVFRENEQGEIRQFIHAAGESGFRIAYRDVRQEQEREGAVKKGVQEDCFQPFDLATGPLLRVGLYQLEDHKWVLNYVLHHIISDGWSMDILIKEVLQLYHTYVNGTTPALPPLGIQYKDYAAWQQEQLSGESLQQHKSYWLNHFAGELPVLDLPGAKARPAIKTYHGDAISRRMSADVNAGLRAISQEQGSTLFMALLAAVNALLYRYTGQEDIIIGTPVAGREHADLEDQIGFYANTLALRTRFSGTDNYKTLLLNTREVTLGAHEHQVYPFDELVDSLHIKHDRSRNPLFDVQVVLGQHAINRNEAQHLGGLEVKGYEGEILPTSRFDMVFGFFETGDGLHANIQYNTDIYTKSGVTQLADHLEQLMRVIVANPDKPLNQLVFLSKADQHQLLEEFNDTTAAFPRDQTILDLFEEQVRQHPDNIAVVHGSVTLTYKELDERSNQLAHYLRHHYHLGADDLVGIMLDRSEKMILSVLAVLKSGAAYVPVDPEYPAQRKAYIIEDTGIKVLITQTEYMFDVAYYKGPLFAIDVQLETLTESVSSTRVRPDPDHLAYVIYTSGSTGNPKGVMIEHHSLVDLSIWQKDYFKLDATKKISQMGSFSFDGSVGESIMSLTNGCTLVIINKGEFLNLVAIINKAHIDVVVTVPSMLKQLDPAGLTGNPMIVSVGDKCSVELYDQWKDHCHFINGYGPTEYTVYSHVWHSNAPVTLVPIGKCRTNLKTYITDGSMNLLPVGASGEIYLSGPGIGRGYFNNRKKTFESFRPNHFYLDTVYKEMGEVVDAAVFKKRGENTQIETIFEKVSDEIDTKLSSEDLIPEIEKHFSGSLQKRAIKILEDNSKDAEFKKAFLRYYYEGMFNTYKTESISWNVFLKLFSKDIFPSAKGADFGCGSGELVQNIYNNGVHDIIGIDINPYFIENLVNKNISSVISRIDTPTDLFLQETNLEAKSMDFVISTLTLDRVQHPNNLLQNMSVLLKEGGRFILGTLLPVIEHEDGTNQSSFNYTRFENKLTPGIEVNEDKYYLLEALIRNGITDLELFKVNTRVISKNGIQDYELFVFCGNKQENISVACDYIRMYKTGDLGRWLPDGNIDFTGRNNDQVKIRGIRIELGEIETILQNHEEVDAAIVIARTARDGEKELIAYVVSNTTINTAGIRSWLSGYLPDYMVPNLFVQLAQLPLTPNGKIDRKNLPEPETSGQETGAYIAPRNEIEEKLVLIWEEVLGREKIGISDDFFDLGGHSLKAFHLVNQVNKEFDINIRIQVLFNNTTIEAVAGEIEKIYWASNRLFEIDNTEKVSI
jgi:tyrocidine synthetase-3